MNLKKLTVMVLSLFTLGILVFSPIETNAKEKEKIAHVDVNVATLWTEPGLLREIDAPSASNPVDMNAWIGSMNYEDKLWLVGNLETQALYGSKVTILEEQGEWVKVAVANQPTPRNDIGYPGWMPKAQLKDGNSFEKQFKRGFALVNAPKTWLYSDSKLRFKFMEVSFDTRLPLLQVKKDKVKVMTPSNGAKWIEKQDVSVYQNENQIPAPTGKDIVDSGKEFLGLPYLWAGMSGFGFDCSGFTYTMYHANGITIPRDSSVQAQQGKKVEQENLQPGDLLFFAYDKGKGRVHHVGMYIGDGKMIHSPNSSTHVRIDEIKTSGYGEEYAGARRYID
ncbi:NlpC/P60 family protein [Peribacillus frigoritolerans]|uniref:C40 family peptidase n=1 Tax=Peribacillus frigoritolerans TaxID=450367 RepID=UPI003D15F228